MKLKLFPQRIALCKLLPTVDFAGWQADLCDGPLNVSISDPHGKTVLCSVATAEKHESEIVDQSRWRCIQIDEFFELDSIGIVAQFSKVLAKHDISLFVISSYETDYLLIQPKDIDQAVELFKKAGHTFG